MDRALFEKFLAGNATDAQRQQVETLLSESGTIVDEHMLTDSDSLIDAIRHASVSLDDHVGGEGIEDEQRTAALVERIQALVPRQAIGKDELEQVLDPPEQNDELGRIARFRVLEFVACGGMGLVFKANDPDLNREVCIKIMNPALAAQHEAKQRFDREARAAAGLQCERIVTVLEVGQHRQLPYLVMPLLEGESLRRRLQHEQRLEPELACRLAIQVAQGLRYAHARGYLHRDIKPDNIWLTPEDDVILLDLGLARAKDESVNLTHSGTVLGTPCYMSPEQVQGDELSESSDLFSLGIVLFEMLTGVSPFDRANVFSTMMSVANDTLPIPLDSADNAIPSSLVPIIRKLLEKDPAARPQSADEVIDLLKLAADGHMPQVKAAAVDGRWRNVGFALAGAVAAVIVLLAAWTIYIKTDKGTLVVVADPSVDVKVADEALKVRDPKTNKEYSVRIGRQPLPSGMYMLEVSDPSSDLVFVSNVVTIRRGSTELVRVELRSDVTIVDSHEPQGGSAKRDLPGTAAPDFQLSNLPALNAAATHRAIGVESGKPIAPSALVPSPEKLPGVDSWSVQPGRPFCRGIQLALSPDGNRIASYPRYAQGNSKSFVTIWDASFDITHVLPGSGNVALIYWSPDPNVLAMICVGDRREVMIWRLCEGHAEILQVIPIAAIAMTWSAGGDQIAFRTEQGVQFYRLADQQTYSIPDTAIRGVRGAWSPDGRLYTTVDKGSVNVWSLETGQMVHIFPKATGPRWLESGDLVIRQSDERQTWCEVWNVDTLMRKDFFALPLDWEASTFVTDDRFERFAVVSKDQKLTAGQIHGPKKQLDLDLPPRQRTLPDRQWRTSKPGDPPVPALKLSRDGETVLLQLTSRAAVAGVDDQGGPVMITPWTELAQPRPPSFFREAYRTSQVLLDRTSYDMETGISLSAQPFDLRKLLARSSELTMQWSPGDNETGGIRQSPSGTYLALAKGNVTIEYADDDELNNKPVFHASSNMRVLNAATGKDLHEFETENYVQHLEWSEDERFLVLTSSNGSDGGEDWSSKIEIFDIQQRALRELPTDAESLTIWPKETIGSVKRAEITDEHVHPLSRTVGNQLLVPRTEFALIFSRGPLKLAPVRAQEKEVAPHYRGSRIYRYTVNAFDLDSVSQNDSQLLGYYLSENEHIDIARKWISWRGLPISTLLCEKVLSGEGSPSGADTYLRDLTLSRQQFAGAWQLNVMAHTSVSDRYLFGQEQLSNGEMSKIQQSLGAEDLDDYGIEGNRIRVPQERLEEYRRVLIDAGFPEERLQRGLAGTERLHTLDPSYRLPGPFRTSFASATCLSADGDYLCIYGASSRFDQRGLALHVLSTERLSDVKTAEDADFAATREHCNLSRWDSPDRPTWHHARPVLAWHDWVRTTKVHSNGKSYYYRESAGVKWYDAKSKTVNEFKAFDGEVISIRSMVFGWILQDECSVLAFNHRGDYLGRWVDGSPPSSKAETPQLNCWIDAAGSVRSSLPRSGFNAVMLRGNQFTVTSLESFQSEFADQLPAAVDPFDNVESRTSSDE